MKRCSLFTFALLILVVYVSRVSADDPENVLKNGDFEFNLDGWMNWTDASAAIEVQVEGKKADPVSGEKVAYIEIIKPGAANWHIQFYQQPFTLEKGKKYTYSLWGKSDGESRQARIRIIHQGDPWNEYATEDVTFNESWAEYFVTFSMTVDDASSRCGVILGGSKVDVWLDHIRLYEGEYFSDLGDAQPRRADLRDKLAATWGQIRSR